MTDTVPLKIPVISTFEVEARNALFRNVPPLKIDHELGKWIATLSNPEYFLESDENLLDITVGLWGDVLRVFFPQEGLLNIVFTLIPQVIETVFMRDTAFWLDTVFTPALDSIENIMGCECIPEKAVSVTYAEYLSLHDMLNKEHVSVQCDIKIADISTSLKSIIYIPISLLMVLNPILEKLSRARKMIKISVEAETYIAFSMLNEDELKKIEAGSFIRLHIHKLQEQEMMLRVDNKAFWARNDSQSMVVTREADVNQMCFLRDSEER